MKKLIETLYNWIILGQQGGAQAEWLKIEDAEVRIMDGLWDYLALIGFGLSLVFFIAELNKVWALNGSDMNLKALAAPLLKFAIVVCCLCYGGEIIGLIVDTNNYLVENAQTLVNSSNADLGTITGDDIIGTVKGFFVQIFAALMMLISAIVNLILMIVWAYKAVMYKLELVFRIGIAPISCADVYNGLSSSCIKYIKGFLAMGIYGLALVVLPTVTAFLGKTSLAVTTTSGNFIEIMGSLLQIALVAPFAALSGASIVKQLAKEALGC